jgi:hypothetical protein
MNLNFQKIQKDFRRLNYRLRHILDFVVYIYSFTVIDTLPQGKFYTNATKAFGKHKTTRDRRQQRLTSRGVI